MKSTQAATTRKSFALGILVCGSFAVWSAGNVHSLVESIDRLTQTAEVRSPRLSQPAGELLSVDRGQFQSSLQTLRNQAWWTVAVLMGSVALVVGLMMLAARLVRHESARRQTLERRLKDREVRLQAILDSEPECIKLIAEDGTLVEMNAAGLEMIEVGSASQVVGQRVDSLVVPEHRRDFQSLSERVFRGESGTLEFEIVGHKGGRRWLDTHASPLRDERGRVIALLGVTRDITARKLAGEAMREANTHLMATLDAMPDLLFDVDETGRIYDFRAPHPELLYVEPKQFLGKCIRDVLPTTAAQIIDRAILDASVKGLHRGTTYSLDLPQGKTWFELSIARKGSGGDTNSRFVLLSRDITDRKRIEQELLASRERLAVLSRRLIAAQESERGHVARELHDEIGQVLTAVSLNLHHLKAVCGSEANSELDASLGLVDHAMTQVRDLSLNLRPPMLDVLGLDAAVRSCVEQHRKQTGCEVQLDLHIESRFSSELEITCYRVIQSALTNVARHAQASRVSVGIRENDLGVELTVCDNGIGLDINSVRQRSDQGESFGILAMQERVQLLGGTFRIDSATTPGSGTSILAQFPSNMATPNRGDS